MSETPTREQIEDAVATLEAAGWGRNGSDGYRELEEPNWDSGYRERYGIPGATR